ncbi:glutamate-cysteine ligase family protein [Thioalkalivibrio sp. ALJ16]|uniref:glutamate-cysteine ligase family protein n=1 Tax=Thioalkalivibrio sp. ALJ16 TaxID=1158762 RepID=UPI00037EBA8A|nr:glutamate-cysteine ligase family protein [Thioalkalivibrio sp. ALJ16]
MGREIREEHFGEADHERFRAALADETARLLDWLAQSQPPPGPSPPPRLGFEIEAWLCDSHGRPLAVNDAFLEAMASPLATLELAQFNVELNSSVFRAGPGCFRAIRDELEATLQQARRAARHSGAGLLMAGSLPTLEPADLGLQHMSHQARYRALNAAILEQREQRPLEVDIVGHEHLRHRHSDVMLEAAATSFQVHIETRPDIAHHAYNAALMAAAPVLAVAGNTPYIFGHDLWAESRIPLFEQAVEVGGFAASARGPIRRVTFGTGYLHDSIGELFTENLEHFPVLLPVALEDPPDQLPHLAFHNGTIWRWNRPIIGCDGDGRRSLRLEFRCLPAGPSLTDMLANTAFALGLIEHLVAESATATAALPFSAARDNFYNAARYGLEARLHWDDGDPVPAPRRILRELLPQAVAGLDRLGIDAGERDALLAVIAARVENRQTGAQWQRAWVARHGRDWPGLVSAYRGWQSTGEPVHTWGL